MFPNSIFKKKARAHKMMETASQMLADLESDKAKYAEQHPELKAKIIYMEPPQKEPGIIGYKGEAEYLGEFYDFTFDFIYYSEESMFIKSSISREGDRIGDVYYPYVEKKIEEAITKQYGRDITKFLKEH